MGSYLYQLLRTSLAASLHPSIRPHKINFMDDGFSEEKNGASEHIFFLKKILICPKNVTSEDATSLFFFKKKLISRNNGASKEANFFSKKVAQHSRDFKAEGGDFKAEGGGVVISKKKMELQNKKQLVLKKNEAAK